MHPLHRDTKAAGTHLDHLGVEALPYLHAPVGEEDGAVCVDVDQGTRLVQVLQPKGYAVFGGHHGHAPLKPFVDSVVCGEC